MTRRKPRPADPGLVVGYLRTSKDNQDLGLEAQRAGIEAWAAAQGLTVARWHAEQLSGTTPLTERPALLEALAGVRDLSAAALVVLRRDRIARDVLVAATVDRALAETGARLLCAEGPAIDDSPHGSFTRTVLDAVSQLERDLIALRTRQALAALKRSGVRLGAYPFGWDRSGRPIDHEQAALQRMRELAAEGFTQKRIAYRLQLEGFKPRGQRWHVTSVARALRSAAESGEASA